jgi:hypothetical protein
MTVNVLLIACGALAREIVELTRLNNWNHLKIQCLPAELHNRPEKIPAAVRAEIEDKRDDYEHIFVAYADCGTGGMLDKVLVEYGIQRLPGAHCYEFFAGSGAFNKLADAEPGTFYLTDFLTRHFDRLVRAGLGLDKHPELMPQYFGNYRRLVYLAQSESPELDIMAGQHAGYLGLDYERVYTGLEHVGHDITEQVIRWQN